MDKIELAKSAVKIVSGFGVSRIINSIVANNVATTTLPQKVCVFTATVVAGSLAAEALGDHSDQKIDEVVAWYHKNVNR